ncbi:MAG: RNase P/RNase MRP subunit POP5 [Haloquadratum sp. J07HQX50]|jgi:RNase P/RNase MRP subunit POP5|nr:MAG: RNase P/RNase MRP subunit POP5 [Haloquadratum sp. J07HQX50]
MKHLPKHLRPRWRYLAVRLRSWPDATLNRREFQETLWYTAQDLIGDVGSQEADLQLLRFNFEDGDGEAVIRTYQGESERARAVVGCVSHIGSTPVGISVIGVSGTIRACEERYLNDGSGCLIQRRVAFRRESASAVVRDFRIDIDGEDGYIGATELDLE